MKQKMERRGAWPAIYTEETKLEWWCDALVSRDVDGEVVVGTHLISRSMGMHCADQARGPQKSRHKSLGSREREREKRERERAEKGGAGQEIFREGNRGRQWA